MDDGERLARIEAKLDALTEWSGYQTSSGIPLTVAEFEEVKRLNDESLARYEEDERQRLTAEGWIQDRSNPSIWINPRSAPWWRKFLGL